LLTDGTRWQWRPQINLVEALREKKDAEEVALIRHAGGIATRAKAFGAGFGPFFFL